MKTSGLTAQEVEATRRAMLYWTEHWDWECPTLFGVELEEMVAVVKTWPLVATGQEELVATCALGAWRELLYGASSVEPARVGETVGMSYSLAESVCTKVRLLANAT